MFNPETSNIDLHELWGQPFGAAHAVSNFNMLAEWATRVVRRLLHLLMDHFFDDYFIIEPERTCAVGVWAFKRVMFALGLKLDCDGKSQPPTEVFACLGVIFDLREVFGGPLVCKNQAIAGQEPWYRSEQGQGREQTPSEFVT